MDDLQSWWEVPSIAHFCSLFRVAFNLLDFDIEELEEALLTDGVEINGSSLLQELIVRLLSGCFANNGISVSNYQMYLRRLFRTRCREEGRTNPFNTDIDFQFLPLRTKVEILHALCDFRLDAEDVVDVLKNLDSDSLRVHPLGYDGSKSAYWYFYGTRLYREDYPKHRKKKEDGRRRGKKVSEDDEGSGAESSIGGGGLWHVICFTEADWERVTKSFANSTSKDERALYSVLSEDFLPEIPRLFAEKERLQRKRLLESAPRRTSSRIEKLKKQAEEDVTTTTASTTNTILVAAPLLDDPKKKKKFGKSEDFDPIKEKKKLEKIIIDQQERRAMRALRRSQSTSDMDYSSDASLGKPTGRQTNNSLSAASATGANIYISGDRHKVKSSHQYCNTREVLMTGLYKVLDKLKIHSDAGPFMYPVKEIYAPRYYSVIARPMDLQTMEDKLDNGEYGSLGQFKEDFQLIVDNCRQYNGSDNEFTRMVSRLHVAFNLLVERHVEADGSSEEMDYFMSDNDDAASLPDEDIIKEKSEQRAQILSKALSQLSNSSKSNSPLPSDSESTESETSNSSKDEDWKKTRYNYNKKDKSKNKRYKSRRNRLRKRMKRKENIRMEEEKPPPTPPPPIKAPSPLPPSSDEERIFDTDSDREDRVSILDNMETSGSEELLGTSDEDDSDEDDDEDDDEDLKRRRKKQVKRTTSGSGVVRNAATMEELDEELDQAIRDITKWLDDTPRYSDFSSNSNSPLHIPFPEDMSGIDADVRRRLHSEKHMRPRDRFSNELHRRKVLREQVSLKRQRTIDRLQPGKSKGNLLSKENLQQENGASNTDVLGSSEKENDTPKLSLGKVLASDLLGFGVPTSDPVKKEEEEDIVEKSPPVEVKEEVKDEKPKDKEEEIVEVKVPSPEIAEKKTAEVEKIENKKEKPTPNLSAWFKAFGAPKSQATVKKKNDEEKNDGKKEEDALLDEDRDKKSGGLSPVRRQRRTSTGSSVSERSSFSQDQFDGNSPRPSFDEPYLSPQQDPLKPYHHSPVNGTIKVGFYQDTCFPRSSSDKSSSPREGVDPASVSPRTPYVSPHDRTSPEYRSPPSEYPNPHFNNVPSSFHHQNPPIYSSVPPPRYPPHIPYYDASKPIVDQYKSPEKTQLPVYPVKKRICNEMENTSNPKITDSPSPSAFKSGSFIPTKEAVEQERTFTPTPGRIPTGPLLPAHIRLIEAAGFAESDARHYSAPGIYPQEAYEQSFSRVLPGYRMQQPPNHFPPPDSSPNEPSSPLNFSNTEQNKKEDYPQEDAPLNFGKDALNSKGSVPSLAYNRINEVNMSKSPYNQSIPYSTSDSPTTLYKGQGDLMPGKMNYNHPMADLIGTQGPARYNYPVELMQGKPGGYNQLELMSKGHPYLGLPAYHSESTSKTERKDPEPKPEQPKKKTRKKKNDVQAASGYSQFPPDPKPAGSAFNFGSPIKDNYSNYLEGMGRGAAPSGYYPPPPPPPNETGGNPKPQYFLPRPPPQYPFMNPAQYQQLLQREELLRPMLMHLPPGYHHPPASHAYLPMHESMNRPSWL